MTLIIGTKNNAKIGQIRGALKPLGLEVQGLPDLAFPEIKEDGLTALENARGKAIFYAAAIGSPVLSTDNALYLDGLAPEQQPGLNVRRIGGRPDRASDTEVLIHYSGLVKKLGGRIGGYWEYGICLAYPDGRTEEMTMKSPRLFVSQPSPQAIKDYPMESIQICPETGRYIAEMTPEEQDDFWQKSIGRELCDFIKKIGLS